MVTYFICDNSGPIRLRTSSVVADASKDMAAMNPSMMMMGGTGAMDFGPAFKQECEALQLLIHKWGLVDIESKLLTKWRLEANGDATKRD